MLLGKKVIEGKCESLVVGKRCKKIRVVVFVDGLQCVFQDLLRLDEECLGAVERVIEICSRTLRRPARRAMRREDLRLAPGVSPRCSAHGRWKRCIWSWNRRPLAWRLSAGSSQDCNPELQIDGERRGLNALILLSMARTFRLAVAARDREASTS